MIWYKKDEDLFAAQFDMGIDEPLFAIIDNATDFIAVNGIDCEACDSVYDITRNLDQGAKLEKQ